MKILFSRELMPSSLFRTDMSAPNISWRYSLKLICSMKPPWQQLLTAPSCTTSFHVLSSSVPPLNVRDTDGGSSSTRVLMNSLKVARWCFLAFLLMWWPDSAASSAMRCFTSSMRTSNSVPSQLPLRKRLAVVVASSSWTPSSSLDSWIRAQHSPAEDLSSGLLLSNAFCRSGRNPAPLPSSPAIAVSSIVEASTLHESIAADLSGTGLSSPLYRSPAAASQRSRRTTVVEKSVLQMKADAARALRLAALTCGWYPVPSTSRLRPGSMASCCSSLPPPMTTLAASRTRQAAYCSPAEARRLVRNIGVREGR
mmetsp:Transcript_17185/g.34422  ORF Transcript_17185/g.34422 Transcript_17185/m.34422 type:complete len:311 (+) Transcript_17185:221-1153(+)